MTTRARKRRKAVNGARAIMASRRHPAHDLDYSPTPPWATRALIERVLPVLNVPTYGQSAWEPACGEGHMAEVLREYFSVVWATDIYPYGYGRRLDFLKPNCSRCSDWIITNPPFKEKAEQFALLALERAQVGVAIFARLQWLETIGRYDRLFKDQPPTLISFFCERVALHMGSWKPNGGTATAYIWLIWIKGRKPQSPFWIPPDSRKSFTRPDDAERFTAHPVIRKQHESVADSQHPLARRRQSPRRHRNPAARARSLRRRRNDTGIFSVSLLPL